MPLTQQRLKDEDCGIDLIEDNLFFYYITIITCFQT